MTEYQELEWATPRCANRSQNSEATKALYLAFLIEVQLYFI